MFYIKQGDRLPDITGTVTDADGAVPGGLSTASATFIMAPAGGGSAVVNTSATITNPTTGLLTYTWGASDTATAGRYNAEFKVTMQDGRILRAPNDGYIAIIVKSKLA